jgi:hypothetical protein
MPSEPLEAYFTLARRVRGPYLNRLRCQSGIASRQLLENGWIPDPKLFSSTASQAQGSQGRYAINQFVREGLRRRIDRANTNPNAFTGFELSAPFHHLLTKTQEIPTRVPIQVPMIAKISLCG